MVAGAIRPGSEADGMWALPKGNIGRGEDPEATAVREVAEETRIESGVGGKARGDVRYVYTWGGKRIFKIVSFYLLRYRRGRIDELPAAFRHEVERALAPARGCAAALAYRSEREMAEKALAALKAEAMWSTTSVAEPMYALNYYSPIVADQLRTRRRAATIRLGDKSAKYKKGMIVQVLAGARYNPRTRSSTRSSTRSVKTLPALHRARSSTTTPRSGGPRRCRTSSASSTTGRSTPTRR